jgi:CRISPR-associated endonuclease/helicase Cas3
MGIGLMGFDEDFKTLTEHEPFPWQRELYARFISDQPNNIPASCNIPTGLGKTSVIAVWLIALIRHETKMPRRLAYVVNRRTVVDQTTNEVEKLRENLRKLDDVPEHLKELAISTLRGQFADNRQWSADPSKPAVVCGTVDMIGSRLLFSGYGIGFKSRPLHAGFLGQDTLIVHDEAHLEPAFQNLLEAIEKEQRKGRFPDHWPIRVMELSATSRGEGEVFGLGDSDLDDGTVRSRIYAKKLLVLHPIGDEKKQLAEKLAELALAHKDSGRAVLVFVRTVFDLEKVLTGLSKAKQQVQQLTGTLRGRERNRLVRDPIFIRFLPESNRPKDVAPAEGTVYLICTSAGEVGVNISAHHLIGDLSTFESIAQRLGRVNRFGFHDDTRVDIVHPTIFDAKNEIDPAREKTLALLKKLGGDGSPAALSGLNAQERAEAFSPQPRFLLTSDILFDAWAMTTIYGDLPGRPPVAEYLHGVAEWEPAQTKVAWRREVWEIRQESDESYERKKLEQYAAELLEDYPLKTHELLTDRSDRVFSSLEKPSAAMETPVWVVDDENHVSVTTLGELIEGEKEAVENKTVLLPPQAGGFAKGLLEGGREYDEEVDQSGEYDVADEWFLNGIAQRKRGWPSEKTDRPRGMKVVREIVFDDADGNVIKTWPWYARILAAEADAKSTQQYHLAPHLNDARDAAAGFVSRLHHLDGELRDSVVLAARFHDLGKNRERWQRGIGNQNYPQEAWAKSGRRRLLVERSPYRHEFGSVLDVKKQAEFERISAEAQKLVLHLIAAHHGRARPHFTADEAFDDERIDVSDADAIEAPRRFAELQRKYGRWGLAYLESLVRAADYAASEIASHAKEGGAS